MRWTNTIDSYEARRLRRKGLKYKEIGKIMAKAQQRETPYQAASISNAIRKR